MGATGGLREGWRTLRGSARLRARIDQLRLPFDRGVTRPSTSPDEAVDRLAVALDRYRARQRSGREIADRLAAAIDVIPQGIVLADADGTVVFRNRAASGFVAARHGEALVESAIAELIASAADGVADTRTLDLFGPPRRSLQLRAVPLLADDDTTEGAFLVVEDVSERQRLDAVRRDFVSNISHELKTPIGALGLLAETLVDEDDPATTRRLAHRVQKEAERVGRTIDDLLALSRIEAGELPSRDPVPVRHVLAEAVDRARPAAEVAGVELLLLEPESALVVLGDRRQLVSAVSNLCDNAVKYTDPGGSVEVSARRVGDRAELVIADSGIGIPSRDLERVFERFYRVDRARSRETGGTGLGLAIVRHVAQNHDGEVTVTSREGEGSTFVLSLPCARSTT